VIGAVVAKVQFGFFKDGNQIAQTLDHRRAFAEFVGVVEIGKIAARQLGIGRNQRLDDAGIDAIANIGPALERHHIRKRRAFGNDHRRDEIGARGILVADVFDEQHEQHIILVLAGIHAAAQLIARGPDGAVQVGFFDCARCGKHHRGSARPRRGRGVCGCDVLFCTRHFDLSTFKILPLSSHIRRR